jgi:hypothetical protein
MNTCGRHSPPKSNRPIDPYALKILARRAEFLLRRTSSRLSFTLNQYIAARLTRKFSFAPLPEVLLFDAPKIVENRVICCARGNKEGEKADFNNPQSAEHLRANLQAVTKARFAQARDLLCAFGRILTH